MHKMRFRVSAPYVLGVLAVCVCLPVVVQGQAAQLAEADRLDKKVIELHQAGRYAEATPLAERSLAIYEKALGPRHLLLAAPLNNLAELYREQGDYARAEPLFQRALAIRERALGQWHPLVANTLTSLAFLYRAQGDYARAEALFQRALDIDVRAYGREHLDVSIDLNNLAALYYITHDYARAEPLLRRALAIREKVLQPGHPLIATSLNNLALFLFRTRGDYSGAETLFQRALAIYVKALGPEHPEVASALNNLAGTFQAQGDYARAASYFQRALAIKEKVFGPEHPEVATTLNNLAGMYVAQGDIERAISSKQRADAVREKNVTAVLNTGSQQQKQLYLYTVYNETNGTISLHTLFAPQNIDAARLALTVILQRKGRVLDAMSDQITTLRRRANPDDQKLLAQLASTRSRLATLQLSNAGNLTLGTRRAEIARLEAEQEQLENSISRLSAEFRAVTQVITLDAVRQVIPVDAALIELFVYYPFNTKARGTGRPVGVPHYVAYILRHKEDVPLWAELGDAASIEYLVRQLHAALRDPKSGDFKQLARALDERVMRPIRKMLGPTRRIFLAPDGLLNLIPFASLVDENGHYLIENYSINYLTSGRDLLRLQFSGESRERPMVFADPLYDLTVAGQSQPTGSLKADSPTELNTNNRRSKDFTALSYRPLPGTAAEAVALGKLFPDATVLMQVQATEAALKRVNRPRFLHIATHGFFLSDQIQGSLTGNTPRRGTVDTLDTSPLPARWDNPLLRSGLILAGVRQGRSGADEDGVLTAMEMAGLDLWGTKLVVLSACETGLGDVQNGAGVYGLRRALVLAGSETQMMSLWKVSDAGTRDLMTAYYVRLQKGEGRTEALRQVQLQMLRGQLLPSATSGKRETNDTGRTLTAKDYRHPYYWAAFIQSGYWRSMDGK